MAVEIAKLSAADAVKALTLVAEAWMSSRGTEVYVAYYAVQSKTREQYDQLPEWLRGKPKATEESGAFARRMLEVLIDSDDADAVNWTKKALKDTTGAKAHVDPITLSIGGTILIAAILAARVKKIGSATFYKGIPVELAKVVKAGSNVAIGK